MQREQPTLYIVEGDPDILTGLRNFLEPYPISVQHFSHPQAFLNAYEPEAPGCVIADLIMPDIDGPELQGILKEQAACLPIIFMASLRDLPTSHTLLNTGVFAFLEKPLSRSKLLSTIKSAFQRSQDMQPFAQLLNSLTVREKEVFELLVDGHTNKVIAERLDITDKTVEAHRSSIMRKTESSSLANLIHINNQLRMRGQ
ncbi:MAG: response regulator transcription factor [Alphaproteobacteria bacterium]|nr:MAG: response regulator transcription factor [Alphaproteobacteria bacterium]